MISQDQLRLILSLIILIPVSFFIRFIKPTPYRYLYSITLSFILQLYVFQSNMIGLYIQSIIVFLLIKLYKGKHIGSIITIQSMLFLSFYHIKELIYNYGGWAMDASALLMILVCKYSLLAYAIQDRYKKQQELTEQQKMFKINQQLTFYDYVGYLNFLPSSVIGPPIQYIQYKRFMQLQTPYQSIPSTIKQTLSTLSHSFICAAIYIIGQLTFPISYMKTPQFFKSHSSLYVLFYSIISVTFIRFKYYFGWKLSISSIHASGVSYNGKTDTFHLINTCSPVVIQTNKHIRDKISHWNTAVQEWLRKAVYQRAPFKSRGIAQLYVFMVSAFWHGFYAGYYFSFFLWFVQVYTQAEIFRFVKHQTSRLHKFYKNLGLSGNILLCVIVNCIFSHNAAFFILLDYQLCFNLLAKVNYIPQTILLTLTVTFTLLNMLRAKKQKSKLKKVHKQQKQKVKDEKIEKKD